MKIEISEETLEFLNKWLYDNGAEAWYTSQIKLDLSDYDGAIKDMANQIAFLRCLNDGKLSYEPFFETTIRTSEQKVSK